MKLRFLTENTDTIHHVEAFISSWKNDNDVFETLTSGSTGKPKVIEIKKGYAEQSARATIQFLGLKPQSNCLLCLPTTTIGGKMMIVRSTFLDATLYVSDVSRNPLQNLPSDLQLDFIAITPMQLSNCLQNNLEKLKAIKHVIVGGGIISSSMEEQLIANDITVYQTFGMTETISHIALKKVGSNGEEQYSTLQGVSISSEDNKLIIDAPHLGCHNLITNDIVTITSPTSFIWKGRADFAINSGGIKLHPEMIENQLSKLIQQPFFVFGIPDEVLGERLILGLEGGIHSLTKQQLQAHLDRYQVPKEIWYGSPFSYTHSKKLQRLRTIQSLDARGIKEIL